MTATKIEWTDEVWNPVTGCSKVSQGCKNCYAERLAPRVFAGQKIFYSGPGSESRPRKFTDVLCHSERLAIRGLRIKQDRIHAHLLGL